MNDLIGVDGCADGWLCLHETQTSLSAKVVSSFAQLFQSVHTDGIIAIDVPIGLPEKGARTCDLETRRFLKPPRASSVFPAPIRAALVGGTYENVCKIHYETDGRSISKQAFCILDKIGEVDNIVARNPSLQSRIREIHPEVSFALWNNERAMQYRKSRSAGRAERESLINAVWPRERERLNLELRSFRFKPDDLNDAFAALWTARRIHNGTLRVFPMQPPRDRMGLRMEIVA